MEEEMEIDVREEVERIEGERERTPGWTRFLSISTILIAVLAAIASLASGAYSNEAVLEKNNAVLYQNKASDQWSYYQAKGIKKNLADAFYRQYHTPSFNMQAVQYGADQKNIETQAHDFEQKVEAANQASEHALERHHKLAFSVTFFQIAIALSALAALLKRREYFAASILFAAIGTGFMFIGFVS